MKSAVVLLGACILWTPAVPAQAPRSGETPEAAEAKRERELKMPEIVEALRLREGSRVADIGAGEGYYEIPMARAVGPEGRVYAEDINSGAVKRLRERVDSDHLANVEVIEGAPADPKLPAGTLDGVLMVIMYHEIEDHQAMLERVMTALKAGGRLVIVELAPHKTLPRPRADQTKNHVIAADLVESEVREAGFEVVSRDDHFIDRPDEEVTRWMIVFRKPAS